VPRPGSSRRTRTPGTVHHEVRLVADRRQKRRTRRERHGEDEREGIRTELEGDVDGHGDQQNDGRVVADDVRHEGRHEVEETDDRQRRDGAGQQHDEFREELRPAGVLEGDAERDHPGQQEYHVPGDGVVGLPRFEDAGHDHGDDAGERRDRDGDQPERRRRDDAGDDEERQPRAVLPAGPACTRGTVDQALADDRGHHEVLDVTKDVDVVTRSPDQENVVCRDHDVLEGVPDDRLPAPDGQDRRRVPLPEPDVADPLADEVRARRYPEFDERPHSGGDAHVEVGDPNPREQPEIEVRCEITDGASVGPDRQDVSTSTDAASAIRSGSRDAVRARSVAVSMPARRTSRRASSGVLPSIVPSDSRFDDAYLSVTLLEDLPSNAREVLVVFAVLADEDEIGVDLVGVLEDHFGRDSVPGVTLDANVPRFGHAGHLSNADGGVVLRVDGRQFRRTERGIVESTLVDDADDVQRRPAILGEIDGLSGRRSCVFAAIRG
jgi:hypothetical protein